MQKYWNTVQDEQGRPRYGALVAVQQSGVNSSIYSDSAGLVPVANPLTTDATRGYFEFYVAAGAYDLVVSGVGFASYTITNGAEVGLPSTDVTFVQSGTAPTYGFATRTAAAKMGDVYSVKDFKCADGLAVALDDSHDDTTGLQAASDWCIANKKSLDWSGGIGKITDAISIGQIVGGRFFGSRSGGLKQYTSNKQIFKFTTCDSHSFELSDLQFDYNTPQTSAQPNSVAVYFEGSIGTQANGFYNFGIRRCTFTANCYRHIVGNLSAQLAVWGWELSNNVHGKCPGRAIYLSPSPSIGLPRCAIRDSYFDRNGSAEAGIDLNGINNLTLQNLEFNNGSETSGRDLTLTSCTNVLVLNCRSENYQFSTGGGSSIWLFSSCTGTVLGAQFGTINYALNSFGFAITSSTLGISAKDVRLVLGTVAGGVTSGVLNGVFNEISGLSWVTVPSYGVYSTSTYNAYLDASGNLAAAGALTAQVATAIPAGGTAGKGVLVSSATNFGIFFGSSAPTLSAAKGSLYLRSDGTGTTDRMYVNTNGATTWTAVTTVA